MKCTKKFLACFLAITCSVFQFAGLGFTANAYTAINNLALVEGLDELLLSDENITRGFKWDGKGMVGAYNTGYTKDSETTNITLNEHRICDGDVNTGTRINTGLTSDSPDYVDLTFSFMGSGAKVTNILIKAKSENAVYGVGDKCNIFASEDLSRLYDENNEIFSSSLDDTTSYLTFTTPVEAKYFGIRFYKAYYVNVYEAALIGTCNNPDYSVYTNAEKIEEAIAALGSESDLTHGFSISQKEVELIAYANDGVYTNGAFHPAGAAAEGYENNVFDGNVSTIADVSVSNDSGRQFYFLDENKDYRADAHMDIKINLKGKSEVERLFISQRSETRFHSYEYAVYVSDSDYYLFNEENRRFFYEDKEHAVNQVFDFETPVEASFIGIRIYKGVSQPYGNANNSSYPRFAEIAVFGQSDVDNAVGVVDEKEINLCKQELKSDYNLMQSGYYLGKLDKPSYVMITGTDNGQKIDGFGKTKSYNNGVTNNAIFDGDLASNADINTPGSDGKRLVFFDSDGFPKTDTYVDISICLTHPAKLDKIFIANRENPALRTCEYGIFTSNSLDTLYDAENEEMHYLNDQLNRYQVIKLDNAKTVKYLGMRIYKATAECGVGVGNTYPRLEEIAVFGKYDVQYHDYTVDANIDGVISIEDSTFEGKSKEVSVPLVHGAKSFKEWKINGEVAESRIDQYEDSATTEFTVNDTNQVMAVYEDTPTKLTSAKYEIDEENSRVRIPAGEIFHTASVGFNAYRGSIEAHSETKEISDGDYISTGATIEISNAADSGLTVTTEGDYNLDGTVGVTDIVNAIDNVFAGEHTDDSLFAFDANNSGAITVSDIVKVRGAVLEATYDVTAKTLPIAEVEHKTMGRTVTDEDESLYFDFSASGFSFNTYCYGDINIETKVKTEGNIWLTVLVDGKENAICIPASNDKQTVTIAKGLSAGEHTIEVYKQNEGDSAVNVYSVSLQGEILDAPENADLLIEFVGDSITCGYGNMVEFGLVATNRVTDGYQAYGTKTARLLNADWSNVSKSGGAMIKKEGMTNAHIPSVYKQQSYQKTAKYDFSRTADIVVINLGTNDSGLLKEVTDLSQKYEIFMDATRSFVNDVLELNGEDTKIVFAFGLMTEPNLFDNAYMELVEEYKAKGIETHYCRLKPNTDGDAEHPSVAGGAVAAEDLANFIKRFVLK